MDEFGRSNGLPVKGYKVREVIISNRGFLKWNGTLFQVVDIASQTLNNSWRNCKLNDQDETLF